MGTQQFCLKWNNHHGNLVSVFDNLLNDEKFVDVTLACEGRSMKAHKLVLSACSPFFEEIFKSNPCKHPVVILKDMKYTDLKTLLVFMYKGEVSISQDKLACLLRIAESLQIKGLTDVDSEQKNQKSVESKESKIPKRRKSISPEIVEDVPSEPNSKSSRLALRENTRTSKISAPVYRNNQSQSLPVHFNSSINQSPRAHIPQEHSTHMASDKSIPQQNSSSHISVDDSSSVLQPFSQNHSLVQQDVKVESELGSPIIVEDQMMSNEEYILEPSAVEEQTLDESSFMTTEMALHEMKFSDISDLPNCEQSTSQEGINSISGTQIFDGDIYAENDDKNISSNGLNQSEEGNLQQQQLPVTGVLDQSGNKRECPFCLKKIHYSSYKRHIDTIHLGYKKVCEICQRSFSQTSSLLLHKRMKHYMD